jgi:negative regulator of flagellin synthesis FlgM
MQIHGPMHVHGPQPLNPPHRMKAESPAQAPGPASGVDKLDISAEAELISRMRDIPDIRADRVAEIRAQLEAGTYETLNKLDTAVDRLLDEIA